MVLITGFNVTVGEDSVCGNEKIPSRLADVIGFVQDQVVSVAEQIVTIQRILEIMRINPCPI